MAEFAEAIVQLYPTEEGGRKRPLKLGLFIYTLHFRVSKDSVPKAVEPIGGAPEIRPGYSGLIQVMFFSPQTPTSDLRVGCHFYLYEGSALIGEGEVTKRWQDEIKRHPGNLNPTIDEVKAWAYDENAWLADCDEDLFLCTSQYISVLKELVLDQDCAGNKKKQILKMFKLHSIS